MRKIQGLMIFVMLIVAQGVWADSPVAPPVNSIKCRVGMIHPALPNGSQEFFFEMPVQGTESHGGAPQEFTSGNQKVTVLADGKWLGISWSIDGKIIAEAVTVLGDIAQTPRVLIVYDPADSENNQVSLGCSSAR